MSTQQNPLASQGSQGSKGDSLNASANEKASGDAGSGTTGCQSGSPKNSQPTQPPKGWTLHVLASTKDGSKGQGSVSIQAGTKSAGTRFWSKKQYTQTLGTVFSDNGTQTFDLSATGDDWISDASKTVTLNDGDNKVESLVLRPRPWIAFQFIDDKSSKDVPAITLSLKLPKLGDTDATYEKDVLKIGRLDPGTGDVKQASHDVVWSAEKVEQV